MKTVRPFGDPLLEPYREAIAGRARYARTLAKRLAGGQRLADWASAHEYYGLHRMKGGWVFREWAPNATGLWLVGDFSGWKVSPQVQAEAQAWHGRLGGAFSGARAPPRAVLPVGG